MQPKCIQSLPLCFSLIPPSITNTLFFFFLPWKLLFRETTIPLSYSHHSSLLILWKWHIFLLFKVVWSEHSNLILTVEEWVCVTPSVMYELCLSFWDLGDEREGETPLENAGGMEKKHLYLLMLPPTIPTLGMINLVFSLKLVYIIFLWPVTWPTPTDHI